jgi:hypothetical protein
VWKVNTSGAICVLATGLLFPSAVNFGVGSSSRNLYVVGFDGHISELANVLPAPAPARRPSGSHHGRAHRKHHPCRDPDRDRDCDSRGAV